MKTHYCTNCGEPLGENANFCTSCGSEVKADAGRKQTRGAARVPWFLILGGALVLIAGIWWLASSRPEALPTPTAVVQQPTAASQIPYPEVPRATVEEVKTALDAGTAIVVDVRGLQYYQAAHIAGALSLPTDDLEAQYQTLPQDQMIYLYCT